MEISHDADVKDQHLSDLVVRVRDTLRRRWLTLLLVAALVFAGGVALVLMLTPQYQSVASVRIDPSRNPLSSNPQAESQASLAPEAIETEVSALSSPELARQVVSKLHLETDPEYTKALDRKVSTPLSPEERISVIAEEVLKKLAVSRDKLTYILTVKFTSRDAIKSARIANTFAELYISSKVGSKLQNAEKQAAWFKQRLDEVGREVQEADARVAQYRARAGLTQGTGTTGSTSGTITDQQVGPLSAQLAIAESEAAAARANLAAAEGQRARGGGSAVGEVLGSTTISDLRRQRAEILRSKGEVEARYGDRHPEAIRVRDQLASVDTQLRDETSRVIASLRGAAEAASARANSLRGSMNALERKQASNTENSVMAQNLEREAAAKRATYDRMSQMSLQSTQATRNSFASAEIVGRAEAPTSPTSPNKPLLFALAAILALGIGTGVIAVQEMLVSGLRTTEDIENQLNIPVLAAVPRIPRMAHPADMLLQRPTSLFAESFRIARASIIGVGGGSAHKVIAITSSLPSEGKTTTALAFARTLAMNGAKTLLLECDVRRAAMRRSVGTPPKGPGIVEVLHGEATLAQAIHPGDVPGLDHLLVRAPYFSSENLFGDHKMEKIIQGLRGDYELIVLDLPPLLGLADGRFLAVLADATVLAIRWNETPAAAAKAAVAWLKSDGANLVGAMYTMVDSSAQTVGGLYYSKKYSAYYQQP